MKPLLTPPSGVRRLAAAETARRGCAGHVGDVRRSANSLVAEVADGVEHVLDVRQVVRRGERRHDLAAVRRNAEAVEARHDLSARASRVRCCICGGLGCWSRGWDRRRGARTRPFEAEIMPKRPIIARRPLLISARSAFSLRSGVILAVKPKGSHRFSGTGCGNLPLSDGK